MKKLIYCALALAAGLFATSCMQENLEPVQEGNTVTFTVEIPEVATKAIGEANDVDNLVYAVYRVKNDEFDDEEAKSNLANVLEDGNDDYQLVYQEDTPIIDMKANVTLELINDQRYVVIFWAQHGYTWFTKGSQFVKVDYPENFRDPNNDARDAFTNVSVIRVNSSISKDITLVRPFAQLNIATTLPDTSRYPNFSVDNTTVKVTGLASSFNVGAQVGKVEEGTVYEVNYAAVEPIDDTFGDYEAYLSMNYVFVPDNRATVKVSYDIVTNDYGTVSNQISNVPVARNYKTNIIGELLTSDVKYNVELEDWYTNDNSGTTEVICDGLVKNQYGDYEVTTETGLAYAINNLFAQGGDFYLTKALYDLTGYAVNPPAVPTGVVLNIYGETPIVTRSASDITAVTGVEIRGLSNLIDEVVGSASISGVKLSDDDAVLVNDATEGTLVVSNCEAETILPEGKGEVLEADKVENLAQLQAALVSGVKEINVVAGTTIEIPANAEIVLNLNGKTVTGVDNGTASYSLIANKGKLTVEGQGAIKLSATTNRGWNAYSSVISNSCGNLTVNGEVIIEHFGGTDMAYGIDNLSSKDFAAEATINGGTIKSTYRAIRQFLNSNEKQNVLTVNGGVIEGANKSIWMQDPNKNSNFGTLTVGENAQLKGDVYLFVTEGSTGWPVEVLIAESALMGESTVLSGNVPETHSVVNENGFWTVKTNEAIVGEVKYLTFAEAVENAKSGETIKLLSNVTLGKELTLPAGVTLNGNGKQIDGTIYAGGNLTFAGHTKVTSFSASYYNRVITIGEGACLEITGTGRVTLGYGNTFDIIGSVTDAKTAEKSEVSPSLIIPGGISITGSYSNPTTMNVANAYVQIGSTSSKNSAASGEFTLNFTNSIAEFTNQLTFAEPTNGKTPTFNLNVTNSVLTTGTKLIAAAPNCNVKIDNSEVTLSTYFRNSGKFDVVNHSVLTGSTIQFGENGGNDGALTVDASTVTITASSKGHALDGKGTGSITLKNAAVVKIEYVKDMILAIDEYSTFTGTKENCVEYTYVADGLGYDKTKKTYAISTADGLVALANMGLKAGDKVILTADIDLADVEFNGLDTFHPENGNEFDGQNHKVSNWTNNRGVSDMGFIRNWVGTIKNLTIENASLKTSGRSAIVGAKVYGNIENCHVVNCTLEDSYWACGLIAGLYNAGNISDCSATNSTVKSNGGTGAIVGVVNESAGTRSFTNCVVTGCTVNNTGDYGEDYCGALVCGMINIENSTVKFIGCEYSDNTKAGRYVGDRYYAAGDDITIVVE